MIDPLDTVEARASLPIVLRPQFITSVRTGSRTHLFASASFVPGTRSGMAGKGQTIATKLSRAKPGDRLWVQEEVGHLYDRKGANGRAFYTIELPGGHVPVPGGVKGDRYRTSKLAAKDLKREDSRFTLEVTAVRLCRAWDITWEEIKREGSFDPHASKGAWWGRQYGLLMPWERNHEVVGIDFTFTDGNIDTGERWAPEPKPVQPPNRYLLRMNAPAPGCQHARCPHPAKCLDTCSDPKPFGTRAVND